MHRYQSVCGVPLQLFLEKRKQMLFAVCLISLSGLFRGNMQVCPRNGYARGISRSYTLRYTIDQTSYLAQSQYSNMGPTSPCTCPIAPDPWDRGPNTLVRDLLKFVGLQTLSVRNSGVMSASQGPFVSVLVTLLQPPTPSPPPPPLSLVYE